MTAFRTKERQLEQAHSQVLELPLKTSPIQKYWAAELLRKMSVKILRCILCVLISYTLAACKPGICIYRNATSSVYPLFIFS